MAGAETGSTVSTPPWALGSMLTTTTTSSARYRDKLGTSISFTSQVFYILLYRKLVLALQLEELQPEIENKLIKEKVSEIKWNFLFQD